MQKIASFFLLLFLPLIGFSQTETIPDGHVKLLLSLQKNSGEKVANKLVRLVHADTKEEYKGETDAQGKTSLVVKMEANYLIFIGKGNTPQEFFLPKTPYKELELPIAYEPYMEQILPTETEVLLVLSIVDFDKKIIPNKAFILEEQTSKKTFKGTTDSKGLAELLVPRGGKFYVHLEEVKKGIQDFEKNDLSEVERDKLKTLRWWIGLDIEEKK